MEINLITPELLKYGISEPLESKELSNQELIEKLKTVGVYTTKESHLIIYNIQFKKIKDLLVGFESAKNGKKTTKKIEWIIKKLKHLNLTCIWDPR